MVLEKKKVYLLLGSNMGDREQLINAAIDHISRRVGDVVSRSAFYETAAWGKEDQPSFINVALEISTPLSAEAVLDTILDIEHDMGRVRLEVWGARLIDIDLIFFGNEVIEIPNKLIVPHPELQNRRFVLEPLVEIAPNHLHPKLNKTVSDILISLQDKLSVSKINL